MSWTPPAQDGGDPVTAYSVTPYIGFTAQPVTTFTSSATTETVTGLTDGTAYTFRVSASTDAGTGPASSDSAPLTPATLPSAPLAVNGVAGDEQVVLSWTPPAQDGGDPVTAYSVTPYIGFTAQPVTTFTSSATTETVTGLTDGTAYTFTVTASTDGGDRTGLEPTSAPLTPATLPSAPLAVNGVAGDGAGGLVVDPAGPRRRRPGHRLQRHPLHRVHRPARDHLHLVGDHRDGHRADRRHRLHLHRDGQHRRGDRTGLERLVRPSPRPRCPRPPWRSTAWPVTARWSCRGPRRPKTAATRSPPTASPPTSGSPPSP